VRRYRLTLSYDGKNFCGWSVQPGQRSIQKILEEACRRLYGEVGEVTAAGRTDAGVHARGQTVHVDLSGAKSGKDLVFRLNAVLPEDLVVLSGWRFPVIFMLVTIVWENSIIIMLPVVLCHRFWIGNIAILKPVPLNCLL
jgi:tRNA U38,U39,U40 pseudouridine synthase TruA